MTTIKFEIIDDDYRIIETHKWNTRDWERVEKTFSYIRKKYGKTKLHIRIEEQPDNNSWVSE